MKFLRKLLLVFAVVYLLPRSSSAGLWYFKERPQSWHDADWSSSRYSGGCGCEPAGGDILSSRRHRRHEGGGSQSHAWIVTKDEGAPTYNRYEKVGWGKPIRKNAYPADGRWYSNEPRIVAVVRGEKPSA